MHRAPHSSLVLLRQQLAMLVPMDVPSLTATWKRGIAITEERRSCRD